MHKNSIYYTKDLKKLCIILRQKYTKLPINKIKKCGIIMTCAQTENKEECL